LQYSTDINLELETLTSTRNYDANMWSPDLAGSSTWVWDGVNHNIDIVDGGSDIEAVKILKSYEYGNIDSFKIDFVINNASAVDRYVGLYSHYIDALHYMRFAAEIKVAGAINIYADYKYGVSHTEEQHFCSTTALFTGIKYTFEIEQYYISNLPTSLYQYITKVYIYVSGTAKNAPKQILTHDVDHLYEGNIGLFAKTSVAGNINVDISDLNIVGKNIWNRGILKNTIYDDLNWDTTSEILVNEGTIGNWTNNTTDLCLDVDSAVNLKETFTIKNVILGNGGFRTQVRIDSTGSIQRDAGIIFASTDGGVGTYYSLVISVDAGDNAQLRLMKYGSALGTSGAYGIGGYGIYGYGGVGNEVILAQQLVLYIASNWYNIECEFDRNNHTFDCYYWEKGSNKPLIPTFSYSGDTYYNIGNVGLTAKTDAAATGNINASFKNLCVTNAEEANALNGTFLSNGGIPHGSRYHETETIRCLNGTLTDLEYAKYNLFVNTKVTDGAVDAGELRFINTTDDTTLSIESANKKENITAANTWTAQNELIQINDDDEDDIGIIGIDQLITGYTDPIFLIDFISLIPVSRNEESRYIYMKRVDIFILMI